jgi:signal transduction histidine kinase
MPRPRQDDEEGVGPALHTSAAEVESERLRWRESILRGFLWTTAATVVVTSAFVVPANLLRWGTGPFLVLSTAVVVAALGTRLPFRLRAAILFVAIYLACALSLLTAGLAPNAMVGLCVLVVMTTVLLGRGWGAASLALSLLTVLGSGALLSREVLARPVDWYAQFDGTRPAVLARVALVFTTASSILLVSVSMLLGRTERLLQDKARAVDAMQRARQQQEKVQRDLDLREEGFRRAREIELVGRLAGCAAHDLNNILTVIGGYAKLALTEPGDAALTAEALAAIDAASTNAALTTSDLRAFGPQAKGPVQALSLAHQINRSAQMLRRLLPSNIEVRAEVDDAAPEVWADEASVQRVITNLALNARDAMRDGGMLCLRVRRARPDERVPSGNAERFVVFEVADSGSGMDEETLGKLFQPFFTTKGSAGTGLGLASVHELVTRSGGHLQVESRVGHGTTFTVFWPQAEKNASRSVLVEPVERTHGRILVVDDDRQIRNMMTRALGRRGYSASQASNVEEALQVLGAGPPIELLLTDCAMSGLPVERLVAEFRARCPTGRVLLCTGYAAEEVGPPPSSVDGMLPKPFSIDQLLRAVGGAASNSG